MPARTWPSSEARKSTIALPMPVASRTQPSSTKIGTDSRMMLDMPSSMRPIITKIGTRVAKARKHSVPRPKQNAIGTPTTRHTATNADEEDQDVDVAQPHERRRQQPAQHADGGDQGDADGEVPQRGGADGIDEHDAASISRMPNGDGRDAEAVRNVERGRGDVPFLHHVVDRRLDHDEQEGRDQQRAQASGRRLAGAPETCREKASGEDARCGRCAMAEPSMASHRKQIDAASSIQTTGMEKT